MTFEFFVVNSNPSLNHFEDDQEPVRQSVLRQTVALMDEVANNTIPFVPNAAR